MSNWILLLRFSDNNSQLCVYTLGIWIISHGIFVSIFKSSSVNRWILSFRAKSPSFAPNPSMYSDALNASLQSALGFAENNLPFLAHSGASMASFHHHQQQQRDEKHGLERWILENQTYSQTPHFMRVIAIGVLYVLRNTI